MGVEGVEGRLPCVVYLHCNGGSRRDAEEALCVLTPLGVSVFSHNLEMCACVCVSECVRAHTHAQPHTHAMTASTCSSGLTAGKQHVSDVKPWCLVCCKLHIACTRAHSLGEN